MKRISKKRFSLEQAIYDDVEEKDCYLCGKPIPLWALQRVGQNKFRHKYCLPTGNTKKRKHGLGAKHIFLFMLFWLFASNVSAVEFTCKNKIVKEHAEKIYPMVCEILDMEFKGSNINIVCFNTNYELTQHFKDNAILPFGLYIPETETIYVSLEKLTERMLAHEIGHAVITNYSSFHVSTKAQEILCGYVEYIINRQVSGAVANPEKNTLGGGAR